MNVVMIIRILLGSMFVFSGIIKLYPIETFELSFVDLGVASWSVAPFMARLLISVEIGVGALLILGVWQRRMLQIALGLLSVFTLYLIYLLLAKGNDMNCGCFGEAIPMTPLESLLKNMIFAGVGSWLLWRLEFSALKSWKKWTGYGIIGVAIATPFILYPVLLEQNVHAATEPFELDITDIPKHVIDGDTIALNEGEAIVAFLSVSCKHCKNVAYKLSIAQEKYDLPRIVTIFIGKEEKLPEFWKASNSEFPHVFFKDKRVFKITSGKFPTIMHLQDGKVINHWTGGTFTANEIEKLGQI